MSIRFISSGGGGEPAEPEVTRYHETFASDPLSGYEFHVGTASDLAVASGELAPATANGVQFTVPEDTFPANSNVWAKIKHKWTTTEGTNNFALILRWLDANNFLMGSFARGAGTDAPQIYKCDGGAFTSLALGSSASPASGVYNWLAFKAFDNYLRLEVWTADPVTHNNGPATVVEHTLAGANATKYGTGIAGKVGYRHNLGSTTWRYDDLVFAKAPW